MICATKSQTSQIMAKAVDDVELIMVPLALMEKWMMEHRSWYEFVNFHIPESDLRITRGCDSVHLGQWTSV
jgi:hypothetical protein